MPAPPPTPSTAGNCENITNLLSIQFEYFRKDTARKIMSQFEIEIRGPLTLEQKNKLEKFLSENGKIVKEYERSQWIFGLSLKKRIDLRIKVTNGVHEFVLKVGKLGSSNRKEISIPFPEEKLDQSLEFLKHLGKREGVTAVRNAKIYQYKDIEWAVVEVPGHSYYFEAEKLVDAKSEGKKAQEEMEKVANKLGLKVLSPAETIEYIGILDKEANKRFTL